MLLFESFMNCIENNAKNLYCKSCKKDTNKCEKCEVKSRIEKIRKKYSEEPCLKEDDYSKDDEEECYLFEKIDDLSIIKKYELDKHWKDLKDVLDDCVKYSMTREQSISALELFYKEKNPFTIDERIKEEDLQGRYGRTLLHEAVLLEDEDTIKKLINDGVDVTIKDNSGYTPYMIGVLEGKVKSITLLKSLGIKE